MNFPQIFIAAYLISLVGVSAFFYKHKDRAYAENKTERISSPAHFSLVYRLIQFSTVGGILLSQIPHQSNLHVGVLFQNLQVTLVGLALATAGISLFVWAKNTLAKNYSPCFESFVPFSIVSSGPYRFVRHPIYTANIFFLLGIFLATGNVLNGISLVTLGAYYLWSASKEEKALVANFPEYSVLQKKTGRFLPKLLRPKAA